MCSFLFNYLYYLLIHHHQVSLACKDKKMGQILFISLSSLFIDITEREWQIMFQAV